MRNTLTNKKYQIPTVFSDTLVRNRLFNELEHEGRFTLVSAPSGYGKSTLVASWLDTQPDKVWINLSKKDSDLLTFSSHVLRVVESKGIDTKEAKYLFQKSEQPSVAEINSAVLSVAQTVDGNLILVLDDYHHIASDEVHQLVSSLIEQTNVFQKLVLISRFDPPLPIVVWRQQNLSNEIRVNDLKFTGNELTNLLGETIEDLSASHVARIESSLDGWIAGIRLLAFGVGESSMLDHKLQALENRKNNDFVSLVNWHLKGMAERKRQAVLLVSLFDYFSRSLFTALDHVHEGEGLFESIASDELLIVALDEDGELFRFHHLFHQTLMDIAQQQLDVETLNKTLHDGAYYFHKEGDTEQAIQLFLKAGEKDEALTGFSTYRKKLINQNQWQALERITNLLNDHLEDHPLLDLTRCWLHIHYGQTMELFNELEKMEKKWQAALANHPKQQSVHAEFMALKSYHTYHFEVDHQKTIAECEFALANLGPDWIYPKGYAWVFLLGAYQATGELQKAQDKAQEVLIGSYSALEKGYVLFVMCYIYWLEADLYQLVATANQLIQLGEDQENDEIVAHGWHFKILHCYHRGDFEEALKQCREYGHKVAKGIGIIGIFHRLIHASLLHFEGASWKEGLEKEIQDAYQVGNSLMPLFIKSQMAELDMLSGATAKACLVLDELSELPVFPVVNNVDPHLAKINCYLAMDDPAYWRKSKSTIDLVKPVFENVHNKMTLMKVYLYESGYHHRMEQEELAIQSITKAFEIAVPTGLVSPFLEANPSTQEVMAELNGTFPYRNFLDRILERKEQNGAAKHLISRREKDILALLAKKLSNKEIGEVLFISEKTVKNHSNSIFKKLGVKNRREAAHKAVEMGVV